MEYLMQKVSYLKGLAEGMGIEDNSDEGKLLLHIVDALEDFADVLEENMDDQLALEEYVEFIDEDLAEVEDDLYGFGEDFDEDDFDLEEFYAGGCCDFEEEEDEDDDEDDKED